MVKEMPYIISNTLALMTCLPIAIGILAFGKNFGVFFENRILMLIGMISYEIYLIHAFTLSIIKTSIINILIFIIITYVFAYILHIGIDKVKRYI